MRIFAPDLESVLFPVWSNRLWPCIPMSYNIPFCPITASPRNRLNPTNTSTKIEVFMGLKLIQKRVISA